MDRSPKLNVVLLILDAVRARSLSCYGAEQQLTPELDSFARQHLLFRRAFAPSTWTIPTHTSMLTGLYLSQHGINGMSRERHLHPHVATLPDLLRHKGYLSAGFSQNLLFSPQYNFDTFDEFYTPNDLFSTKARRTPLTRLGLEYTDRQSSSRLNRYLWKAFGLRWFLESMRDWMLAQDEPFLVVANISNAHYFWAPPPGILIRHLRTNVRHLRDRELTMPQPYHFNSGAKRITPLHRRVWKLLYEAAIIHVDRAVGRFLKQLRQWKGWDKTILIVTADHGEMLGDHRDIVGHMLTLHDNIIHVPFILKHPDYTRPKQVQGVVETIDLFPSLLEWCHVEEGLIPSQQRRISGLSRALSSPGRSDGLAFAEEIYSEAYDVIGGLLNNNPEMDPKKYPREQVVVRSATHKYVWYDDRPADFYDLAADPDETGIIPSSTSLEQERDQLQAALADWRSDLPRFPPVDYGTDTSDAEALTDRLRALGYVA